MEIRFASINDVYSCNKFYNDYYLLNRTEKQWVWEFSDYNRCEPLPFIITYENSEVVATQAIIKIPFIDEKGVFWTAKSEETLVSPVMRGKSVFEKMYDPILSYAKNEKLLSIWGFTPAVKPFQRVGFDVPLSTKQLINFFSPVAVTKLPMYKEQNFFYKGAYFLAGLALTVKSRFSCLGKRNIVYANEAVNPVLSAKQIDESICERFISRWGGATINRDAEYMKWRVFDNPYCDCSVLGFYVEANLVAYLVYSIDIDGSGYIVDVISAHPDGKEGDDRAVKILLSEASNNIRSAGGHSIRAWSVTDHLFDQLLQRNARKQGFTKIGLGSSAVFYADHGEGKRGTSHDDMNSWYITRLFTQGTQG